MSEKGQSVDDEYVFSDTTFSSLWSTPRPPFSQRISKKRRTILTTKNQSKTQNKTKKERTSYVKSIFVHTTIQPFNQKEKKHIHVQAIHFASFICPPPPTNFAESTAAGLRARLKNDNDTNTAAKVEERGGKSLYQSMNLLCTSTSLDQENKTKKLQILPQKETCSNQSRSFVFLETSLLL